MVFAHHSNVLDGLEEAVRTMAYVTESGQSRAAGYMRIDGSTPSKLRSDHVKRFQGEEDCRVALLSIKAAGVRRPITEISCRRLHSATSITGRPSCRLTSQACCAWPLQGG